MTCRNTVTIRNSLVEGLSPEESTLLALSARQGWYANVRREMSLGSPIAVSDYNVLARAMRAAYPGAVFARAAAIGEVDPLTDIDSRLFVGLGPA